MSNKKIACDAGRKKYVLKKSVFEKEIELCKKLSRKNKGKCDWGKCKDCGVFPLLHKLYKGKLIDNKDELKKIKKDVLKT